MQIGMMSTQVCVCMCVCMCVCSVGQGIRLLEVTRNTQKVSLNVPKAEVIDSFLNLYAEAP